MCRLSLSSIESLALYPHIMISPPYPGYIGTRRPNLFLSPSLSFVYREWGGEEGCCAIPHSHNTQTPSSSFLFLLSLSLYFPSLSLSPLPFILSSPLPAMYSLPPLSWDAAIQHLRGNPLNWALASLSLYYLGQFLFPSPPPASVPKGSTLSAELRKAAALSPDSAPLVFKDYTPEELCAYTGRHGTRILIGVRGRVFDATSGARFYGPGQCG